MRDALTLAIFIRCQTIGPVERALQARLEKAGGGTVFFLQNSPFPADAPMAIEVSAARVQDLGFNALPADWGWRCGDLFLALARRAQPQASGYVMIENDVLAGIEAFAALFDLLRHGSADLAAIDLRRHETAPRYSRQLTQLGLDPALGCLFPLVYAKPEVVDHMIRLRRKALDLGLKRLNDEAIFAGTAADGGFKMLDLREALAHHLTPRSFATNPPQLREALLRGTDPMPISHPVLPLAQILERIADPSRHYDRHRLRRVLRQANPKERALIEAGLDQALPRG